MVAFRIVEKEDARLKWAAAVLGIGVVAGVCGRFTPLADIATVLFVITFIIAVVGLIVTGVNPENDLISDKVIEMDTEKIQIGSVSSG
jgi:hypothetical protein